MSGELERERGALGRGRHGLRLAAACSVPLHQYHPYHQTVAHGSLTSPPAPPLCFAGMISSEAPRRCWALTKARSSAWSGCPPKACWSAAAGTGAQGCQPAGAAGRSLGQLQEQGSDLQLLGCRQASSGHGTAARLVTGWLPAALPPPPRSLQPSPLAMPSRGRACSSLRLWDSRQAPGAAPVARVALPGKVYSMSASEARLVVAMSGRHVDIFDLRT